MAKIDLRDASGQGAIVSLRIIVVMLGIILLLLGINGVKGSLSVDEIPELVANLMQTIIGLVLILFGIRI